MNAGRTHIWPSSRITERWTVIGSTYLPFIFSRFKMAKSNDYPADDKDITETEDKGKHKLANH